MGRHDVTIRISAKDHASKVFRRVAIAAGAFLSLRQFARAAKQSLNLFAEQEKATQKLSAAIKATGGALGYTTRQMREYAHELQNMTTISNESFETAISIMATFRNVSGETFKRSIELAADMSVALGQDLKSSVIQLGKALNDPTIGLTALQRVGITFSETQKKLIKQLVEQNDLLGAQKVMLDELANQFSGQSKKAVEGYAGSVDQLKNSWDDAHKAMGKALATAAFLDLQNNVRLSTILVENYGLTWELVTKSIKLSVLETADSLTKLIPIARIVMAIVGRGKVDPLDTLRAEQLEIQEQLAAPLAERLSALIPTPSGVSKRTARKEAAFREARLSAELTAGPQRIKSIATESARSAADDAMRRVEAARKKAESTRDFVMPKMPSFPEGRFGPQRQQLDRQQRINERREELGEMKKAGGQRDKAAEIQEDILRALEQAPVIQVTNFN